MQYVPWPPPCTVDNGPRFGRAKVVTPSPPKAVPSSENNATLRMIGSNAPLQAAQRAGTKLYGKNLISPNVLFHRLLRSLLLSWFVVVFRDVEEALKRHYGVAVTSTNGTPVVTCKRIVAALGVRPGVVV